MARYNKANIRLSERTAARVDDCQRTLSAKHTNGISYFSRVCYQQSIHGYQSL